jgi:hypothetical protein
MHCPISVRGGTAYEQSVCFLRTDLLCHGNGCTGSMGKVKLLIAFTHGPVHTFSFLKKNKMFSEK